MSWPGNIDPVEVARMKTYHLHRRLRMKTALWGELQMVGRTAAPVLIEELREEGLSFRCDLATSSRLMPLEKRAPGVLLGIRVRVVFRLPGLQRPVELPCRLIFCRRYSQDSFRFDCDFDPRENLQQQRLVAFLERQQASDATLVEGVGAA
jgi:hypothetical protein